MFTQTNRSTTMQTLDKDAYSPHPGSVVIEAFKDLQRKVKSMEEERYQVYRDNTSTHIIFSVTINNYHNIRHAHYVTS